jgi:hypothetical protein
MNPVRKIESFKPRHAFEEKRDEWDAVLARKRRECVVNLAPVLGAGIGRGLHTCEKHSGATRFRALDDLAEILFHLGHGLAAQYIIGPELQYDHPHIALHRPVNSPKTARRDVARNSRVHYFVIKAVGFEPSLKQRRVAFYGR